MPRPTTFLSDVVLDQAMLLFWTQGYAGTSIQDLVDGTAVLRGSLYHAFGDKRSLYMHVLQRYGQQAVQQLRTAWESPASVHTNMRAILMTIVDMSPEEKRRGSLVCNCIAEVVPHDPEIAAIVEGILVACKEVFQAALERGQQTGEIPRTATATALARYVVSSIQGLCMTAKAGASRAELLDIVDVTLCALR